MPQNRATEASHTQIQKRHPNLGRVSNMRVDLNLKSALQRVKCAGFKVSAGGCSLLTYLGLSHTPIRQGPSASLVCFYKPPALGAIEGFACELLWYPELRSHRWLRLALHLEQRRRMLLLAITHSCGVSITTGNKKTRCGNPKSWSKGRSLAFMRPSGRCLSLPRKVSGTDNSSRLGVAYDASHANAKLLAYQWACRGFERVLRQ